MVKNLLIVVCAFASAVLAFDEAAYLVPVDNTGAAPTSSFYVPKPSGCRAVIYDHQTYYFDDIFTGLNITSPNYKLADDFEVDEDWRLEVNRVWISSNDGPDDIIVTIFGDSGDGPDEVTSFLPKRSSEATRPGPTPATKRTVIRFGKWTSP